MNNLLFNAIDIANREHAGQIDKGGNPYILHLLSVMSRVETIEEKIVAIMHDLLEDTSCTKETLNKIFPKNIVIAVDLLTKKENQTRKDYYRVISTNKLAKSVKIADLQDNMNISRIKPLTVKDINRTSQYIDILYKLENNKY